jgi:hypothetical protein
VKFSTRIQTRRVLGRVRVPVGFCKWISLGVFYLFRVFSDFFQVSSFFRFFEFLSGFRFFQISSASAGEKQNPHPNPVLRGSGSGLDHGCKNTPEPAPVGCKTHGLPETQTRSAIPTFVPHSTDYDSLIISLGSRFEEVYSFPFSLAT